MRRSELTRSGVPEAEASGKKLIVLCTNRCPSCEARLICCRMLQLPVNSRELLHEYLVAHNQMTSSSLSLRKSAAIVAIWSRTNEIAAVALLPRNGKRDGLMVLCAAISCCKSNPIFVRYFYVRKNTS